MGANLIFGFFRATLSLSGLFALLMGGAMVTAGPAVRFGLIDYSKAFQLFGAVMAPIQIVGPVALSPLFTAIVICLLGGLFAVINGPRRIGAFALIAAAVGAMGAYGPLKMRAEAQKYPYIHDITTDFENPPMIVAGAGAKRSNPARYVGDELVGDSDMTIAEAQRIAYADLEPMRVDSDLYETVIAVTKVIKTMDMIIIGDGPIPAEGAPEEADPASWRIEAVATSFWFGFKDDFVVRIDATGPDSALVNVRSKSRVGLSDLGANAKRMKEFFSRMSAS